MIAPTQEAKGFIITIFWWVRYGLPCAANACGVRIDWYCWPDKDPNVKGNIMSSCVV
jgi:hypothetical protein